MATVAKGYDLDYAWRAVGEAYRGAGYYLAAAEAGEPPGTWRGPGAEGLGFAVGQQVEREPYNLLFGERKGPDGPARAGSGERRQGGGDLPGPGGTGDTRFSNPDAQAGAHPDHRGGHLVAAPSVRPDPPGRRCPGPPPRLGDCHDHRPIRGQRPRIPRPAIRAARSSRRLANTSRKHREWPESGGWP